MGVLPTRTPDGGAGTVLRHEEWMAAAAEEYHRLGAVLAELTAEDWHRPTDCAEWQVRDVVAHLVGAAESTARVRELVRQALRGRRLRPGEPAVEGINAVQVDERIALGPARLRADLADAGARGLRARSRLPAPLRAVPLPFGPPLGTRPLGYLTDRVYTRDAWMHRVDLCRATGRPLQLTADHDGRIVADVVADWAGTHGQPGTLTLTGPAGGTWSRGRDGGQLTLDAVEFCRVVSGRAPGAGLLATGVPF
ncbi:maleylpyruvate isomerase family mycothiol-dependent enzyme [Modestobacter sp. NPDC049651]|uniref:maleylpyruvate isomerase family mycothiol-dependent enzyme n=1 Tax=unclassified Modestobacter TaxID=2643866 RepID=UPI0033CC02C6